MIEKHPFTTFAFSFVSSSLEMDVSNSLVPGHHELTTTLACDNLASNLSGLTQPSSVSPASWLDGLFPGSTGTVSRSVEHAFRSALSWPGAPFVPEDQRPDSTGKSSGLARPAISVAPFIPSSSQQKQKTPEKTNTRAKPQAKKQSQTADTHQKQKEQSTASKKKKR
ncbi:hypothetical protein BDV97DRAFT_390455 [Delphinella strobiligena]|nr:hypothetical protein BDV97DRAFT_390455 [Delphinella strobiligena]